MSIAVLQRAAMQYCSCVRNKNIALEYDDIAGSRLSRACAVPVGTDHEINIAFLGERKRWKNNDKFTSPSASMCNVNHSVQ
jgi:hypothetical protein